MRLSLIFLLAAGAYLLGSVACSEGAGRPPPQTSQPSPTHSRLPMVSPSPAASAPAVTLVAAGDVMLGRTIGEGIVEFGPLWPFEHIARLLKEADLAFVNLESPLTYGGAAANKDFVFRGPPEGATGLRDAGLDIVSLANNHVFDYGLDGLRDTRAALARAGVAYAGAGDNEGAARAALVMERNGLRLAFLAYVNTPPDSLSGFDVSSTQATARQPGVAWLTPELVTRDVTAASRQADVVIVSMHSGDEYREAPNELQVAGAHAAADAGAALVLGHHPHVLQGIERRGDGLIIYSLGNLVFDFDHLDYAQPGLPSALSALLRVEITEEGVVDCEILPLVVAEEDGRPLPAGGAEAERVLERMRRLSDGACGLG